jgi:hypothetical protein
MPRHRCRGLRIVLVFDDAGEGGSRDHHIDDYIDDHFDHGRVRATGGQTPLPPSPPPRGAQAGDSSAERGQGDDHERAGEHYQCRAAAAHDASRSAADDDHP